MDKSDTKGRGLITSAYNEFVSSGVLDRLSVLDELLDADAFLIGLSEHSELADVEPSFTVISDLVLGFQLYSRQEKPLRHKGEFSYFASEISLIRFIAKCIASDHATYEAARSIELAVEKEHGLRDGIFTMVRSRARDLDLAKSWSERAELSESDNDFSVEHMLKILEDMIYSYCDSLIGFAHFADFSEVLLCDRIIDQLKTGGVPCGWLSKTRFWDLSSVTYGVDYERYPGLHQGVFTEPDDKLALLYLD